MRNFVRKILWLVVVALFGLGSAAMAADREFTLINIKYEGKIMWLPSLLVVKKGERVKLTLVNNVKDDPAVHGYTIPRFNVKADVQRGVPFTVEFDAGEAGLFETSCHLHPAHLHGQLLVLEK